MTDTSAIDMNDAPRRQAYVVSCLSSSSWSIGNRRRITILLLTVEIIPISNNFLILAETAQLPYVATLDYDRRSTCRLCV